MPPFADNPAPTRATLPDGIHPRLLSREQAAAYLGLSPNSFDAEVKAGTFPSPVRLRRTKRRLWDRAALDDVLNLSRTVAVDLAGADWDERKQVWRARQGRQEASR